MTKETTRNVAIYDVMKEFHEDLKRKYPRGDFEIGISNEGDDIENASNIMRKLQGIEINDEKENC